MGQALEPSVWEGDENAPNFVGSVEAAAEFLRELAGTIHAGETKRAIERAGKRIIVAAHSDGKPVSMSYSRAFDIWYRKARRIEQFEQDAIAAAVVKRRREVARNEFHELRTRLARLESLLAQSDPDFHRETIQRVRSELRRD